MFEFHSKKGKTSSDHYLSLLSYYLFLWQEVSAYMLRKGDNRRNEQQRKYKPKIKRIIKASYERKKETKSLRKWRQFNQKFLKSTQKNCFLLCVLQEKN